MALGYSPQGRAFRQPLPGRRVQALPAARDGRDRGLLGGRDARRDPLNCAILAPESGETVERVPVRGYAVSGGDRGVGRVEVSADGGGSWAGASLLEGGQGTWCFWEATVDLSPGPRRIVARAFDSGGGAQPASAGE